MNPTDLLAAAAPRGRADAAANGGARAGADASDEALAAAREFEKLLIHDMLKAARRAGSTLGETPSNARSTYDDMLDEHLAGVVSDAGGLGLAPLLAEQLGGGSARAEVRGDGATVSAVADRAAGGAATRRLATADLLRLRALVRPRDAADAAPAPSAARGTGIGHDALAALGAVSGASGAHGVRAAGGGPRDAAHRAFLEPLLPQARISARRLGTSPDVILAVAALESGWGRHVIADADGRSSHNLFGIKARAGERGAVSHRTSEYLGGTRHSVVADFRAFATPADAVDGFADFVLDNPRYAGALEHAGDPPEFLRRLHAAGYATDPNYADKAIATMQRVRALQENPT